jgi:hypothetical protein
VPPGDQVEALLSVGGGDGEHGVSNEYRILGVCSHEEGAAMKPAEFVTRLKAIQFENDLRLLESAENSFRTSMAAYKGYDALATAFTRFFLDTISVYNRDIVPAVTEAVSAEHNQLIEKLVRAFVTLRAARITAHSGYPLQGFTLLRNIYDDCVLASAAMQGLTNLGAPQGLCAKTR